MLQGSRTFTFPAGPCLGTPSHRIVPFPLGTRCRLRCNASPPREFIYCVHLPMYSVHAAGPFRSRASRGCMSCQAALSSVFLTTTASLFLFGPGCSVATTLVSWLRWNLAAANMAQQLILRHAPRGTLSLPHPDTGQLRGAPADNRIPPEDSAFHPVSNFLIFLLRVSSDHPPSSPRSQHPLPVYTLQGSGVGAGAGARHRVLRDGAEYFLLRGLGSAHAVLIVPAGRGKVDSYSTLPPQALFAAAFRAPHYACTAYAG